MWGDGAIERKPHLVRWETVFLDKRKGGLGVNCFSTLNKALLCKLSCRFANKRGVFWNQVNKGKHGEDRWGWCSREVKDGYGVGLWKAIRKEWHIVSTRLSFVVGNGRRVKF